jgi:hypothetical protein
VSISKKEFFSVLFGTKLNGFDFKKRKWKVQLPDGRVGCVDTRDVKMSLLPIGEIHPKKFYNEEQRQEMRASIVQVASTFLDAPYFWGGRSFFTDQLKEKKQLTSVDCSGLTGLCYQVHGIQLPRNSRSQYIKSKKLASKPKIADLIFFASKRGPQYIRHVMLYCGDDKMIEARGQKIRKVIFSTGREFFGKHIDLLKSGEKVSGGYVYFGSYID